LLFIFPWCFGFWQRVIVFSAFALGLGAWGLGLGWGSSLFVFAAFWGIFFVCHFYFYLLLTNNGVRFFFGFGSRLAGVFLLFFFFSFALRYGTGMRNGMEGGAFCGLLLITFPWGLYY